ncbi:tetratricopeptide repeat protein [Novosphingobium aquiterrae]|uniref:Tetratricopeptide repeat protein n=1 Tax=Novosphingobium aquiterrae TaxID=624388 RepID=A0ABV6PP79_9SPHN
MRRPLGLGFAALLVLALSAPGQADGGAAQAALAKARAALGRGDGIAAEAELRKAAAAGAPKEALAAPMGEALIIQKNFSAARGWLAGGHFARGDQAYGWRMLGMLERFTGNLDAADQAYARALAIAPNDPVIWTDVGRLRFSRGEQVQAIDAANRALVADPDNPRALELRAQLMRDQAGWDAALPLYERALLKTPNDVDLLAGYAATLGEAGRLRDMLTVTRQMIALNSGDARPWFYQAVLAARAGNSDLARKLMIKAGTGLDGMPAATLLRGIVELEAGNANAAVAQFDALVQQQPANRPAQLLLARALYESGDNAGLLNRFSADAARDDASPYLIALLARALEERGDRLGAAGYLDRLARAAPPAVMPIAERGSGDAAAAVRSAIAAGNVAGAGAIADAYVRQKPGMFEALSLAGDAALARSAPLPALDYYRRAAQVRYPERMLLRTVEALEKSGRGGEAPPFVVSYLASWPGSRLAARLAAGHAAFAGDWAQSCSLLEHLRSTGGGRDGRLLIDLSLAQLNADDADLAVETARRAARLLPGNGAAAQAWGMALVDSGGDRDLARQLLDKARRIDGDNPLLLQARKRLDN